MLRWSGRINELAQTAARRGGRAVEQSSYSCALVLTRLRRRAGRLYCGHCGPYLSPTALAVKSRLDRRKTNVRSSGRTIELAQTAARRGQAVVRSCTII
eukprot:4851871-Prymnesium_polylepis.1